jgi:hypothetical protein
MQTLSLFDNPPDAAPLEAVPAGQSAGVPPAPLQQGIEPSCDTLHGWSERVAARIFSDRKKGLKEIQADTVRWTALVVAVGTIGQAKARSYGFARRGMPPLHSDEQLAELDRATALIHSEMLVSNDIPLFLKGSELE